MEAPFRVCVLRTTPLLLFYLLLEWGVMLLASISDWAFGCYVLDAFTGLTQPGLLGRCDRLGQPRSLAQWFEKVATVDSGWVDDTKLFGHSFTGNILFLLGLHSTACCQVVLIKRSMPAVHSHNADKQKGP
ncbi:uncharacterized protein [Dermacentor andersoni]|uniref:uncharacterized protein isoform X2 n=1 Tax=Dermacentor andersoni TaxID=34620 RepID=UPI0024177A28|nr:uncharacterized protein LOC126540663 isoform X2 [Dermacentor andersoni]